MLIILILLFFLFFFHINVQVLEAHIDVQNKTCLWIYEVLLCKELIVILAGCYNEFYLHVVSNFNNISSFLRNILC
jgi:uncharacterized metal-binding protein